MTVQSNNLISVRCGSWRHAPNSETTSSLQLAHSSLVCFETLPQCQNLVYWEATLSREGHCLLLLVQEEEIRDKFVYYIPLMPYNSNRWIFDQYLATSSYGKGLSCSTWTKKALQRTFYRANTGKSCHKLILSTSPPFTFSLPQWHFRSLSALTHNLWDGNPL